jgi:hypothetical protein
MADRFEDYNKKSDKGFCTRWNIDLHVLTGSWEGKNGCRKQIILEKDFSS